MLSITKLLKDPIIRNTVFIVVINGSVLLFYHYMNPDKKIEDYYKEHNQYKYYLFKFTYTILFVSFLFNIRYLSNKCIKHVFWFLVKQLKKTGILPR